MQAEKNQIKSGSWGSTARVFNSHIEYFLSKKEQQGIRFTSNNAVHCSLTLSRDTTLAHAQECLERFLAHAANTVGIAPARLEYIGSMFSRPTPHIHLALRTPKSRKSGFSISRMPEDTQQALLDYWVSLTGETAKLERIYNVSSLVDYWSGFKNAARPGQVFFTISSQK